MKKILLISVLVIGFQHNLSAQQESASVPELKMQSGIVDVDAEKRAYYESKNYQILGKTLENVSIGPGNFIAISDVTIPASGQVMVKPGTNVFFEPGYHINLSGSLKAKGPATSFRNVPIGFLFADIDVADRRWNGIRMENGSSLIIKDMIFGGLVSGISASGKCDTIAIDSVHFENVDGNVVTIDSVDAGVAKGERVSYHYSKNIKPMAVLDVRNDTGKHKWKIPLRIGFGAVALAGVGLGVFAEINARESKKNYETASNQASADSYFKEAHKFTVMRNIGYCCGAAGLSGLTITLFF